MGNTIGVEQSTYMYICFYSELYAYSQMCRLVALFQKYIFLSC